MYKQVKASGPEIWVTWADANISATSRIWTINAHSYIYNGGHTQVRRRKRQDGMQMNTNTTSLTAPYHC